MSDATSELLKAFIDASDERKAVALQVLRGDVTTCPYLRQGQTVFGGVGGPGVTPHLMGMGAGAKYLGVSRATLWRIIMTGKLKKVELFPGSYRLRRVDLDALVAKDATGPSTSRRGRPRKKPVQSE
ncbi:MAG: helix-turn-helix domain-containing protein [Kiritimatiellae bacterium]|nr:helix-turn-helix domain-containing protein [Kiritimatiellia bacterium]